MKLKRITPRTCLWPLAGSLVVSFALSIGLTFRSDHHCYAGVCGEWLFPLQARLHVVIWYSWLSVSVTILAVRAFNPSVRLILQKHLLQRQLPIVGKSLTISGVLLVTWILSLYGIIVGVWWLRLQEYFVTRGEKNGIIKGNNRVAAVALTGHLADVTMGMVLLPVARNSALSSFFRLSASTTFAFHMILAYVLFALVSIHGLIYGSWVAVYNQDAIRYRMIFPVLNPTYLYHEVWPGSRSSLSIWRASLIFTGSISTLIMLAMFLTTFPVIRRKHFNLFYFTHLLSIVAVIAICLHASTMFYCTAPGLAMWVLDWGMRVYELSGKMDSSLTALGKGWFCLTLPLPRKRLSGCACFSPLAHFHIHHTESSIREIHPFTTITHLATEKHQTPSSEQSVMIQFLFRKSKSDHSIVHSMDHPREEKSSSQWTNKLASLVEDVSEEQITGLSDNSADREIASQRRTSSRYQTSLRLEGPYFTPAEPSRYNTVICLVAGTGVSGAIAITAAFHAQAKGIAPESDNHTSNDKAHDQHMTEKANDLNCETHELTGRTWRRCVVVWSVRESEYLQLPFFQVAPGLEIRPHLTGKGHGRLDMEETIKEICSKEPGGTTWVYLSGPNPFIESGEQACRRQRVAFFGARWA